VSLEFGAYGGGKGRPAAVLRLCRGGEKELAAFTAALGITEPPRFLGRDLYLVFLPGGTGIDEFLPGFAAAVDRGASGLALELVETRMVPGEGEAAALRCGPFVLVPPGYARPGPKTIIIAAGIGFGSGAHPSTRIAVELMAEAFRLFSPDSVLDAGCGSGVLSLVAARLGAPRVVGVEIDRDAAAEARENARKNGLAAAVDIREGDAAGVDGIFSLVVANMTPAVLSGLAATLAAKARDGIVVSGFRGRAGMGVEEELRRRGLTATARLEEDGWAGFLALREG